VRLEGASLGLSAEAVAWEESLRQPVVAAAADDLAIVGERFIRTVLGDATWDGFPAPVKQMFTGNSPAILAEVIGGPLQVDQAALAKAQEAFHSDQRAGLQSGEPLLRVAEAKSARVRDGKMQVTDGPPFRRPARISTAGSLAGRSAYCSADLSA
jgi:hypothetical protein